VDHRDSHVIIVRQLASDLNSVENGLDVTATQMYAMTIELGGAAVVLVLAGVQPMQIARAVCGELANCLVVSLEGSQILHNHDGL